MAIELGIRQAEIYTTLNMYINDAIGFGMTPELPLVYSEDCFGTADTVGYRHNILRIHDLKTGHVEADMTQLRIYASLFCLEYKYDPREIKKIVLRIYQNDAIKELIADPADILMIMERIKELSALVKYLREED